MNMKKINFVGSSRDDLKEFPEDVRQDIGFALYQAQCGRKSTNAKPLKGFGGAGVLEIRENHDGDTYRAVYTVKFRDALYVLHCFQKKSKSGIKTSGQDIELIKRRLKLAEEDYNTNYK
ncbi:MAG: type II toxin-antitoxin system RelE/ParE family toxin [Candidatus Omnitrophica bacterium]|nr:type II toxin-antitoxin system RelE/ParE family toxin [Candidatus Omnitrophota bacterium]